MDIPQTGRLFYYFHSVQSEPDLYMLIFLMSISRSLLFTTVNSQVFSVPSYRILTTLGGAWREQRKAMKSGSSMRSADWKDWITWRRNSARKQPSMKRGLKVLSALKEVGKKILASVSICVPQAACWRPRQCKTACCTERCYFLFFSMTLLNENSDIL